MSSQSNGHQIPLLPLEQVEDTYTNSLLQSSYSDDVSLKHSKDLGPYAPVIGRLPRWEVTVHVFAICATVSVVWPSFKEQYWQDIGHWSPELQNNIMKGLQVVSKLHEIIMVASLGHIVLHYTRRLLVGTRGVPLGLLGPSYVAGSPSTLFRRSFWRCFRGKHLLFTLLLMSTSILVLFLGPSSAATMIPSLDWYSAEGALPKDPEVYFMDISNLTTAAEQIWPQKLSTTQLSPYQRRSCQPESNVMEALLGPICPFSGIYSIILWFGAWKLSGAQDVLVVKDWSNNAQRLVIGEVLPSVQDGNDVAKGAIATAIPEFLLTAISGYWEYLSRRKLGKLDHIKMPQLRFDDDIALYQPLVHVSCTMTHLSPDLGNVTFPNLVGSPWGDANPDFGRVSLDVGASTWQSISRVNTTFDWYKDPNTTAQSSLLALSKVPVTDVHENGTTFQSLAIVPCSIDARWAASGIRYQPWNSSIVSSNVSNNAFLGSEVFTKPPRASSKRVRERYGISDRPIDLQLDWAQMLNFNTSMIDGENQLNATTMSQLLSIGLNELNNYTIFQMPSTTDNDSDGVIKETVARLLGFVVADSISRTIHSGMALAVSVNDGNDTSEVFDTLRAPAQNSTRDFTTLFRSRPNAAVLKLRFAVDRYGYGYSLRSTSTRAAIACLFLFSILVLAHSLYMFASRARATLVYCRSWGDIGELVALAASSAPSSVAYGSGSGMSYGETGRNVVSRIRMADSTHDEPQFVLESSV
ncbi:hypothetical protein EJ05DRAFT_473485 [Pseudovirgaria hyperparasitica]|uniref:Uncharacterized protein n=1 Tax=Pseudovirgaria hyperparasitica TaxID=470096 RepID=A0A6A6WDV6_9PEZI|nr:uncharacterized protein EJ05DRAFT_473485 [Pseudovirgaria hyperparasitica]KAF2760893.1 hypothetical protein EJ05DRAFT_473485 [Pseudovirgaria hyperparasitica]